MQILWTVDVERIMPNMQLEPPHPLAIVTGTIVLSTDKAERFMVLDVPGGISGWAWNQIQGLSEGTNIRVTIESVDVAQSPRHAEPPNATTSGGP